MFFPMTQVNPGLFACWECWIVTQFAPSDLHKSYFKLWLPTKSSKIRRKKSMWWVNTTKTRLKCFKRHYCLNTYIYIYTYSSHENSHFLMAVSLHSYTAWCLAEHHFTWLATWRNPSWKPIGTKWNPLGFSDSWGFDGDLYHYETMI
jgi:hypothetical protein